jgi:cytochrome c553
MRLMTLVVVVGCTFSPADLDLEEPRLSPPVPPTAPPAPERSDMAEHDELGFQARAAVVAGDLPEARSAMSLLASRPFPGTHPELVGPLLDEARAGERAPDLEAAGLAVGRIAAACGKCHTLHPARRYPPSGYEEGDRDLGDRMTRHGWAIDAMWQGLVEPSDLAWQAGARALAAKDLMAVPGFPDDPDARAWAPRLAESARAAASAAPEGRPSAYGRVIATCAGCHRATGGGPGVETPAPDAGP